MLQPDFLEELRINNRELTIEKFNKMLDAADKKFQIEYLKARTELNTQCFIFNNLQKLIDKKQKEKQLNTNLIKNQKVLDHSISAILEKMDILINVLIKKEDKEFAAKL